MKKILFLLLFCFSAICVSAQTVKKVETDSVSKEIYWKAVRLYNEEEFGKSVLYFNFLNESDPENYEYSFYLGMCFHNLNKTKLARYYFSKVIDDNTYKFKIMLLTYNKWEEIPTSY